MSWRQMHMTVPAGQAPELDAGEVWDPVTDRVTVTALGGGASYQVRRPGMCSLCPAPGRELQLRCADDLHAWKQTLCTKHEGQCHLLGEVSCLACRPTRGHVDVLVVEVLPSPDDQVLDGADAAGAGRAGEGAAAAQALTGQQA